MRFTKMQGLGNDYVYLDCTKETPRDLQCLAVKLSDRHFGIGADGLICICPSVCADFRMQMFNADGSEGEMCGNGIRCVGKFIYDKGLAKKDVLEIETLAGIKTLRLTMEQDQVVSVTVDMGEPSIEEACTISVKGKDYTVIPVSMGNPHAVLFAEGIETLDLSDIGPDFERHPRFPNRVNTEFVEIQSRRRLNMRVWERGSGETLACGTGACASLAAAVSAGLAERSAAVNLLGGILSIHWNEQDNHIYMTGPAVTVFEGKWEE